ncbi:MULTISPECIES: 6,7-dimethyl-8-ribityllumazine synthase [Hyphomonas]|jgi:6,7-dimethyl-8-ribityllumazine synthase|uniref:6,7-dimethyl-8-ribityllumazine synthase n=2 Tax=Hyphomonas adhaerens TaxID=81029 RepID=A0A069E1P4_9PROT|nr:MULTISPECIES: 6,7-dimethyl-8-ribityllumazine synthase [Hyphomonas]KCZ83428.1 6,7-dimethyl-8-ribityllumazine synthase [Hyphomonas adhaerens MHS-3]MBB38682.1 6,7-dimethyl-8-ribityllumazine synthase [Hyphomonas sp.]HAE25917.1 6,7-dimethyl-8-ribityllumazine synthase [Hyphomonas adhaerens]|tara:strand:+ start:661 stop:1089 length:429 start_codon:yes stop_codon:yes gene_type:complete
MADRVLIAVSHYYKHISEEMLAGAMEVLEAADAKVTVMEVPGAFELPGLIAMGADSGRFDGAIALGCVIRGETTHYDYVCGESARGLMDLIVNRRQAIGYGILTVENEEQALARADRKRGNKGADAANACLSMIKFRKELIR